MNGFIHTLLATGPAAEHANALATYGWLVGDWNFDAEIVIDGRTRHIDGGRIHAAWVLDGRAIQDVWTLPGAFAGTTLRVYDPGLDAWHILWSDPLRQRYNRQLGRRLGERIVQEGSDASGEATRWSFMDIQPERFRWLGEHRADADAPWQLVADFAVRRI